MGGVKGVGGINGWEVGGRNESSRRQVIYDS